MLRKHQNEFAQAVQRIRAGRQAKTILIKVTPGGGKSAIPIIATRLINYGFADRISWVVPRRSLQYQGESNFIDPFFRNLIKHNRRVRVSTNDSNPCRGQAGFVTTFQAIGISNGYLTDEFARDRYVLILDEFHHVELEGVWHAALQPLVERAVFVILMTGTLERGDRNKIAFMPYRAFGYRDSVPDLIEMKKTGAVIEYNRPDALAEKAILPIKFHLLDATVSYKRIGEDPVEHTSMKRINNQRDASAALYTALRTEFARQLIDKSLSHWDTYRQKVIPDAQMLVVTAGKEQADEAMDYLQKTVPCYRAAIATSHESDVAQLNIRDFKRGDIQILVTIAMAYEGLDVPKVSHICSLTNIRSTPWIEQMVARAVRIDRRYPYEAQTAYVFAPDDKMMRKVVDKIKREQLPFAKGARMEQGDLFGGMGGGEHSDITPLGSNAHNEATINLGKAQELPANELTDSELEAQLRDRIERQVRRYCREAGVKPVVVNARIKSTFGKKRSELELGELERCLRFVERNFKTYGNFRSRPVGHDMSHMKAMQPMTGVIK